MSKEEQLKRKIWKNHSFWATSPHSVKLPLCVMPMINLKRKLEINTSCIKRLTINPASREVPEIWHWLSKTEEGLRPAWRTGDSPEVEAELHGRQEHLLRLKRQGNMGNKGYHRSTSGRKKPGTTADEAKRKKKINYIITIYETCSQASVRL